MRTLDRKIVVEKYDEVSRLGTLDERRELLVNQSHEMRTALWQENIDRKTKEVELSAEQKEIIDTIRTRFITVEFGKFAHGTDETDAVQEYHNIMGKASQLLGKQLMRELFVGLGGSIILKK